MFAAYLERVLLPELRRTRPDAVLVMDNLAAHKAPKVGALLDASGSAYRYQPAYSPDLNPIEPAWAKVKAELRRVAARTPGALHEALGPALDAITPRDAAGRVLASLRLQRSRPTRALLQDAGEWLAEKPGAKRRRSWRKLHSGVAAPTDRDVDDASQVAPSLDQVDGSIASVTGDGAYDRESVYADAVPGSTAKAAPARGPALGHRSGRRRPTLDRVSELGRPNHARSA